MTAVAYAPPLDHDQRAEVEAQLWADWAVERSASVRENLVLHHLPYAKSVAARMFRDRYYLGVEFGDFYQFACIGLIESLERYDPQQGASFRTFSLARIEGSVLNGLQRLSDVNEQLSLRRRIQRERLASLKGESAKRKKRNAAQALAELSEIAVGLAIGLMLEETAMYQAEHAEPAPDLGYSTLAWQQTRQQMLAAVRLLPMRERKVVVLHYLHGLSFDHIGSVLQLSKGRISQLHREALLWLRGRLGSADHFSFVR